MSNPLPRRRTQQFSIQHVGQETLIYDEQTHKAFCLNSIAAAVWNRCDGATSITDIALSAALALGIPVTEEVVELSLEDLARDGLLESDPVFSSTAALSRRDVVIKLGSRAALMLPVITAIVAPTAAQAYNGSVDARRHTSTAVSKPQPQPTTDDGALPGFPQ